MIRQVNIAKSQIDCTHTEVSIPLTLEALIFFVKSMETKRFFHFESIINVLVSSFLFI